jgi:competence protein ComEC
VLFFSRRDRVSTLLAVSGENVALVAGSVLVLAWLFGVPRLAGELGALVAIGGYVLAVGAQPSVVRAGIAGALGSLASLTSRVPDRWHFLLVSAIVLLAWNPYTLLDAGFQLSFAAVVAIFVLVPRFERILEGYPRGN